MISEQEFLKWFSTEYERLLRSIVSKTGATREEAEDAVNHVVLQIVRKLKEYLRRMYWNDKGIVMMGTRDGDPGSPLFSYVLRAAINAVIRERKAIDSGDGLDEFDREPAVEDGPDFAARLHDPVFRLEGFAPRDGVL